MCPPLVATTSDNRFLNCPVALSITSWPVCSQQVCRTSSKCWRLESDDGKQAVGVLPRSNNPLDLSLGIRSPFFSTRIARINALVNWCIFTFTSTESAMTSHRVLITTEYLNAHLFLCFLICLCATSVKVVILCNFCKLGFKVYSAPPCTYIRTHIHTLHTFIWCNTAHISK